MKPILIKEETTMSRWNKEDIGCFGWLLVVVFALALIFGVACFEAWILMLLWNWIIPILFPTLPTIGFWLAFGIMMLCNILFGGVKTVTHTKD